MGPTSFSASPAASLPYACSSLHAPSPCSYSLLHGQHGPQLFSSCHAWRARYSVCNIWYSAPTAWSTCASGLSRGSSEDWLLPSVEDLHSQNQNLHHPRVRLQVLHQRLQFRQPPTLQWARMHGWATGCWPFTVTARASHSQWSCSGSQYRVEEGVGHKRSHSLAIIVHSCSTLIPQHYSLSVDAPTCCLPRNINLPVVASRFLDGE